MNVYGKWIREAQVGVWYSVVSLQEVSSEVCKVCGHQPNLELNRRASVSFSLVRRIHCTDKPQTFAGLLEYFLFVFFLYLVVTDNSHDFLGICQFKGIYYAVAVVWRLVFQALAFSRFSMSFSRGAFHQHLHSPQDEGTGTFL